MESDAIIIAGGNRIYMTAPVGVYDPRTGRAYSCVVCKTSEAARFVDALEVRPIDEHQNEVIKPSFDAEHPIEYVEKNQSITMDT